MKENKENKELKIENDETQNVVETNPEIAQENKKPGSIKRVVRKIGRGAKKALPYVGAAVLGAIATFIGLACAGRNMEDNAPCSEFQGIEDPTFDPTIPVDIE